MYQQDQEKQSKCRYQYRSYPCNNTVLQLLQVIMIQLLVLYPLGIVMESIELFASQSVSSPQIVQHEITFQISMSSVTLPSTSTSTLTGATTITTNEASINQEEQEEKETLEQKYTHEPYQYNHTIYLTNFVNSVIESNLDSSLMRLGSWVPGWKFLNVSSTLIYLRDYHDTSVCSMEGIHDFNTNLDNTFSPSSNDVRQRETLQPNNQDHKFYIRRQLQQDPSTNNNMFMEENSMTTDDTGTEKTLDPTTSLFTTLYTNTPTVTPPTVFCATIVASIRMILNESDSDTTTTAIIPNDLFTSMEENDNQYEHSSDGKVVVDSSFYILSAALRRYVAYRYSIWDTIDIKYVEPNLSVLYVEWELNVVVDVSSTTTTSRNDHYNNSNNNKLINSHFYPVNDVSIFRAVLLQFFLDQYSKDHTLPYIDEISLIDPTTNTGMIETPLPLDLYQPQKIRINTILYGSDTSNDHEYFKSSITNLIEEKFHILLLELQKYEWNSMTQQRLESYTFSTLKHAPYFTIPPPPPIPTALATNSTIQTNLTTVGVVTYKRISSPNMIIVWVTFTLMIVCTILAFGVYLATSKNTTKTSTTSQQHRKSMTCTITVVDDENHYDHNNNSETNSDDSSSIDSIISET